MSPGTIKAIARVILAVIIVVITVPGTEACSGGSAPESDINVGDLVQLSESEAFVKSEFAKTRWIWADLMRQMLGNTYKVIKKYNIYAKNDPKIIALPSPDGSQGGRWYFSTTMVTKIANASISNN